MRTFLALPVLFLSLSLASAQNFLVNLDGAQDGGGGRMGTGMGTLSFVGNVLTFNNITFSGLSANSISAHIHGPSGPLPGTAGILYNLGGTFLTLGTTSGTISGSLTLTANPNGTMFSVMDQVTQLNSGLWYINIHTTAFGGGEIRGQILPVPEPGTWALIALGGVSALLWRRRHQGR